MMQDLQQKYNKILDYLNSSDEEMRNLGLRLTLNEGIMPKHVYKEWTSTEGKLVLMRYALNRLTNPAHPSLRLFDQILNIDK